MKLRHLTSESAPVELGKRYRDTLHASIEGVAVSRHTYITGCDRICLEYVHAGEVKQYTVDAPLLEAVETSAPVAENRKAGGPRDLPPGRSLG
jgi:hypothetical protein